MPRKALTGTDAFPKGRHLCCCFRKPELQCFVRSVLERELGAQICNSVTYRYQMLSVSGCCLTTTVRLFTNLRSCVPWTRMMSLDFSGFTLRPYDSRSLNSLTIDISTCLASSTDFSSQWPRPSSAKRVSGRCIGVRPFGVRSHRTWDDKMAHSGSAGARRQPCRIPCVVVILV